MFSYVGSSKETYSRCTVCVCAGHRFRPAYDFDYVALDLLSVYPEDSGVYTCQARNTLGEAVTSCSVKIHGRFPVTVAVLTYN